MLPTLLVGIPRKKIILVGILLYWFWSTQAPLLPHVFSFSHMPFKLSTVLSLSMTYSSNGSFVFWEMTSYSSLLTDVCDEPRISFFSYSFMKSEWSITDCSFCCRHINMHPLGDQYSTNSLSLFLHLHDLKELPDPESGMMIELTLCILDQNHGQNFTV